MSHLMTTMRPFDYSTIRLRKWEAKAQMRDKSPLLKNEQHISPVETVIFEQDFMSKNALPDTPQKKSLLKKREKSSVKEV